MGVYEIERNKGLEQVNTSFIISFVWCVYCGLFLVIRSCLEVLQKGEEPFLELLPFCFVCRTGSLFALLFLLPPGYIKCCFEDGYGC